MLAPLLILVTCAWMPSRANHVFHIRNQCSQTVWVGILGNHLLEQGGFQLNRGSRRDITVPDQFSGRFWGRTGCDSHGVCVTGDCGHRIQCNGAGGQPPATLAEFTLGGYGGQDFYDVSLVDGYNLPLKIVPVAGSYAKGSGQYYCAVAGCERDLNSMCPGELQIHHGGRTVACQSACAKFNTDAFCCRGSHGTPQTCPTFSFAQAFKKACPLAYSYAYDDKASTFTCRGSPHTSYTIQFC
ncbi:uncharacterized protein LOC135481389 [Liolophura sinensis]|uniref:uncharacterized protein LOC135481389 n=1 Tax=Liolophura sinensis TaxID=3198878 RepID=UPI003158D56C